MASQPASAAPSSYPAPDLAPGLAPSLAPSPIQAALLHADDVVPALPAPENKKFYPALDGLRAVAVMFVFYQHYLGFSVLALNWGWTGVDIFFVLSGFLITGILYDTRNTPRRFRNFYVRRTLRIFPLYYGILLIALLLAPFFHWVWHPAWILWPLYLGNYARFIWLSDLLKGAGTIDHLRSAASFRHPFFMYLGHFWSLCVEEQFYLVWPLAVFLIRDRVRLRNLCLAVCVLCLAARIVCVFTLPPAYLNAEILYRFTPLRADALLLGGALALSLRGPEASTITRLLRPVFLLFLAGFALFEGIYTLRVHHAFYPSAGANVLDTIGYTLVDLFAAIVIALALNPGGVFYRVLTLKPLRRMGQVSYGFYVFHDIPHNIYNAIVDRYLSRYTFGHSGFVCALIAFPVTLALSFLSFRFFESRFLRLKDRYTSA